MLSQISPTTPAITGVILALITATAAVAKKYLGRKSPPKPEYITRAEFHQSIDAVRDRIGAGYLALSDKLEQHHTSLLTALDRQGTNFEHRLDSLDAAVGRLDERTKTSR